MNSKDSSSSVGFAFFNDLKNSVGIRKMSDSKTDFASDQSISDQQKISRKYSDINDFSLSISSHGNSFRADRDHSPQQQSEGSRWQSSGINYREVMEKRWTQQNLGLPE